MGARAWKKRSSCTLGETKSPYLLSPESRNVTRKVFLKSLSFLIFVQIIKLLFERELALLVALQGESIWKGGGGGLEDS